MWLIIGYGNPLRGDDGAGPSVAEKLADYFTEGEAEVISAHQLTPEMALEIARPQIQHVLFIDVRRQQATATSISPLHPDAGGSCGHQLAPQMLLQLAAQLYEQQVPGWLLTIAGEQFDFAEQISESTSNNSTRAFARAVEFMKPVPPAADFLPRRLLSDIS